ncbi:MAG: zf-HC2 domain-containing protein, partial [Acidobacteriota bacterium]
MNCQDYREKIGPLLTEDLEPDERIQLERHLEGCPDCRQERELLSETLDQLSSLQEAAVPNHFFVQPEQPRLGPLQLLSRLSPLWKGVFAMLALAVLAGGALAVGGLQVRVEEGALMAGFGSLPASQPAGLDQEQAAALASELLQTVERRIQQREAALTIALHRQISSLRTDFEQEGQQGIETLLT